MANKRIIRRKNRPLNLFEGGGPIGNISSVANIQDPSTVTKLGQGGISGSIGMQSIGSSGKGFNMDSIGGIGSSIGTIVNAGIGNAKLADTSGIEGGIKSQGSTIVGASSNADLISEWDSLDRIKDDYSWKDVRGGNNAQRAMNTVSATASGAATGASVGGPVGAIIGGVVGLGSSLAGWFTGNRQAKKKAKKLNQKAKEANERALSAFEMRAENIDTQNDFNMLANYAAYGGPLNFGSGAISYDFVNKYLNNQEMNSMAKQRLTSLPNSFQALPEMNTYNAFAEGGGLSREKNYGSKKKPYPSVPSGDFAGPHRSYPIPTKADARDALRLAGLHGKESVRRKVLAKYPSLKALGGSLFDNVMNNQSLFPQMQNQIIESANIAADGGGIHIKKKNRGKFTEYCGGKVTSACIAKGKRSSNPTTRKRATFADNARNWNAFGGWLNTQGGDFTNGVTFIDEGGSHEENPYNGVQMGIDPEGAPNLVEEGEIVYDDYVFSDRIDIPDDIRKKYKLKGKTFAKAAKSAQRESSERPNDPLSKAGLQAAMSRISQAQEEVKEKEEAHREGNEYPSMFALGGDKRQTFTRYAPIIGSGVASLTDLFSSPDYDTADMISNTDLGAETVGYTPIGNYLSYNPLDRDYYINKLNQQAASTRRGILDTSGGNRAAAQAGILAADYNYGQNMGNLARQAEEYNQQLRERVEAFNRATNMFNTETGLRASTFNAESKNAAKRARLGQATTAAQMRQAIKDQDTARRSSNITNFLQGLGDMGWENEQANWLDTLAKSGVLKMNTKGEYTGGTKKAKGGKVRTKKKKGLTYG